MVEVGDVRVVAELDLVDAVLRHVFEGGVEVFDVVDGLAVDFGDDKGAEALVAESGAGGEGAGEKDELVATLFLVLLLVGVGVDEFEGSAGAPLVAGGFEVVEGEFLESMPPMMR